MKDLTVTFTDGTSEVLECVDKVAMDDNGSAMSVIERGNYGPGRVVKTYVLVNLRSWEWEK